MNRIQVFWLVPPETFLTYCEQIAYIHTHTSDGATTHAQTPYTRTSMHAGAPAWHRATSLPPNLTITRGIG